MGGGAGVDCGHQQMNPRSTLDIAAIAAERAHRGPAIIKTDAHGRELYEPDGEVLTKFLMSDNKVDIRLRSDRFRQNERDVQARRQAFHAASEKSARWIAQDALGDR
jgi:hypothetical protein